MKIVDNRKKATFKFVSLCSGAVFEYDNQWYVKCPPIIDKYDGDVMVNCFNLTTSRAMNLDVSLEVSLAMGAELRIV